MQSLLSAEHFHNEAAAFEYVEARLWPNGPTCPHCGTANKAGRLLNQRSKPSMKHPAGKLIHGAWKCYACRKRFTVRMGTIFEASHVDMRIWLQTFYLMASSKKGIATRQLHRTFGGSMKTAWFLGHRVREAMRTLGFDPVGPLGGAGQTVEADEAYIGQKEGVKKGRGFGHKHAVLALVERGGEVRSFHVPNVTAATLRPIIAKHAHPDSRFQTDELRTYTQIGQTFAYHGVVHHSSQEYARGGDSTNTVEGYFSILKRGIYGCYFHVSETHLHRYLSEFDFRYSNRSKLGIEDVERADIALKGAVGKRLTYYAMTGKVG